MSVSLELTDCFEILGIEPGAHLREVRSAFRRLALSCHPDLAGPQTAKQFETIAAAYARLKSATPDQISELLKKKQKAKKASKSGSPFSWRKSPPRRSKDEEKQQKQSDSESSRRVEELLLEKSLVEAELSMARILDRANRKDEKRTSSSLARRLLSTHPGVRLLALGALLKKPVEKSVFSVLVEMIRMWIPDDDTVEQLLLLDYSREQKEEIAGVLIHRAPLLSEASAFALLRSSALLSVKMTIIRKLLAHPSPKVISYALAKWSEKTPPDDLTLVRLLKREDEEVLVPLLRILRDRKVPAWAFGRVKLLAENHTSTAVRVWAQSIVRTQNLV